MVTPAHSVGVLIWDYGLSYGLTTKISDHPRFIIAGRLKEKEESPYLRKIACTPLHKLFFPIQKAQFLHGIEPYINMVWPDCASGVPCLN